MPPAWTNRDVPQLGETKKRVCTCFGVNLIEALIIFYASSWYSTNYKRSLYRFIEIYIHLVTDFYIYLYIYICIYRNKEGATSLNLPCTEHKSWTKWQQYLGKRWLLKQQIHYFATVLFLLLIIYYNLLYKTTVSKTSWQHLHSIIYVLRNKDIFIIVAGSNLADWTCTQVNFFFVFIYSIYIFFFKFSEINRYM